MPVLATLAAAAAVTWVPNCDWNQPGHNPFVGDPVAAVDVYQGIGPRTRAKLKDKVARQAWDDEVVITRDAIAGQQAYEPEIRGMHFGASQVCRTVTRKAWTPEHEERGHVACADGACILVPIVCGNVSQIAPARPRTALGGDDGPLEFEPPSAGPLGAGGAGPISDPLGAPSFGPVALGGTLPGPAQIAQATGGGFPAGPQWGVPMVFGTAPPGGGGIPAIPEPATPLLLAAGLGLLAALRRLRRD